MPKNSNGRGFRLKTDSRCLNYVGWTDLSVVHGYGRCGIVAGIPRNTRIPKRKARIRRHLLAGQHSHSAQVCIQKLRLTDDTKPDRLIQYRLNHLLVRRNPRCIHNLPSQRPGARRRSIVHSRDERFADESLVAVHEPGSEVAGRLRR